MTSLWILFLCLGASLLQAPTANAGPVGVSPVVQQGCVNGARIRYGSGYITSETSPWFRSVRGIDVDRQVQFRVQSGFSARRSTASCGLQKAKFGAAISIRERQCANATACRLTPWRNQPSNAAKPGTRFPNQNAGYDSFAGLFRTWPTVGPPAP